MKRDPIYGIMAEFDTAQHLVDAAKATHEAGYQKIDAYSPFPIEGLADEISQDHHDVQLVVLIGGIVGGLTGYLMQYWMSVVDYPLNIGGKPYHSWPSFIVITFEMTILFAAISAVFGMLALNGLPMPYHPVFNVPRFSSASKDRFFLDRVFVRQEVRSGGHASVSGRAGAAHDFGGAQLKCGVSTNSGWTIAASTPTLSQRTRKDGAAHDSSLALIGDDRAFFRLPHRYACAAAAESAVAQRFLLRPALGAAAGRGHGGPRTVARGHVTSIPARSAIIPATRCRSR